MLDILLWPFVVGTPKGSVAASHGVSRAMAGQLGWKDLGTCMAYNLGGSIPGHLLSESIFAQKTSILDSNRSLSSVFWTFLDVSRFYVLFWF